MSDIDEIKSKVDIVSYIGKTVPLKKAGRNFKGLCPFHKEKTPSFMVSPDRQSFHCFGCGAGGSIFDFVMKLHHEEFVDALEELADEAGVKLTRSFGESPQEKKKNVLLEIHEKAQEYYHYLLTKHRLGENAMLYIKNRGITDKSVATFGIGYSPNSWDALTKFLHKKGFSDDSILSAGLAISGNRGLYDRFRGRIMFPLRDVRGRTVGFSGRALDPTVKEAKYINTSETPIYIKGNMLFGLDVTKDAVVRENTIIIMEGEVDVISSFQEGVGNVAAIKGSALTEAQVHLMQRYCQRVVFCLDSDIAGDAAARRGIEIADEAGLDMRVVQLPVGKDPDEAVRMDPMGFKKAIRQAVPVYDYILSSAMKRFDTADPYGKKQASDELMPMLVKISNPIIQSHYIKKVSQQLGVDEQTILSAMKKTRLPVGRIPHKDEQTAVQKPERVKPEEYLCSLVFAGDIRVLLPDITRLLPRISDTSIRRILESLAAWVSTVSEAAVDYAEFAKTLPSELISVFDQAYLRDVSDVSEDPDRFRAEWKKVVGEITKQDIYASLREKTARLHDPAIGETESETIAQEIAQLTAQIQALEKSL